MLSVELVYRPDVGDAVRLASVESLSLAQFVAEQAIKAAEVFAESGDPALASLYLAEADRLRSILKVFIPQLNHGVSAAKTEV